MLRAQDAQEQRLIINFFNIRFRLMASHFSLRGQRKVTKRKATPDALSLRDTLLLVLFHNGTRIDDVLSSMRFRNVHVARLEIKQRLGKP